MNSADKYESVKEEITAIYHTNLILQSNQGWQYQHKQYQRRLREKGIR